VAPMSLVTGLWVYQTLGHRPDPEAVVAQARSHGMRWVTAQAIASGRVLDRDWLREMRRATTKHDMRLGVHGRLGQPDGHHPRPKPIDEAKAMARAIDLAGADFAIINAEVEYEQSGDRASQTFVREYRRVKPDFLSYFSSFGALTCTAVWIGPRGRKDGFAACHRHTRTSTPWNSRQDNVSWPGLGSLTGTIFVRPSAASQKVAAPTCPSRGSFRAYEKSQV
jgi:hypothetical protein